MTAKILPMLCLLLGAQTCLSAGNEEAAERESYVGVSGALMLPSGGHGSHRLGGATVTVGRYLTDFWALEGTASWLENAAGLGVQALGHFQGWSLYDKYFGYSRFDPFVTCGAAGWLGGGAGEVGPKVGLGAYYHLTDAWSLRVDADATLGLEGEVEMRYGLSLGLSFAF